jgi:hypothetical protein
MKTKTENQKFYQNSGLLLVTVILMSLSSVADAQMKDSTETLLKSGVEINELWAPEVKINSIQGSVGTLIGLYGGALINRSFLIGLSGGVNLGHPTVNYGYFGGIVQYTVKPAKLIHYSGQLLIGYGTTKDYENTKSGLLDNFWNISGANFFLMEPGINLEINIKTGMTLITGLSYRYASGLNENNENVQITHLTSRDLSGLNFSIGLKFVKANKNRP